MHVILDRIFMVIFPHTVECLPPHWRKWLSWPVQKAVLLPHGKHPLYPPPTSWYSNKPLSTSHPWYYNKHQHTSPYSPTYWWHDEANCGNVARHSGKAKHTILQGSQLPGLLACPHQFREVRGDGKALPIFLIIRKQGRGQEEENWAIDEGRGKSSLPIATLWGGAFQCWCLLL